MATKIRWQDGKILWAGTPEKMVFADAGCGGCCEPVISCQALCADGSTPTTATVDFPELITGGTPACCDEWGNSYALKLHRVNGTGGQTTSYFYEFCTPVGSLSLLTGVEAEDGGCTLEKTDLAYCSEDCTLSGTPQNFGYRGRLSLGLVGGRDVSGGGTSGFPTSIRITAEEVRYASCDPPYGTVGNPGNPAVAYELDIDTNDIGMWTLIGDYWYLSDCSILSSVALPVLGWSVGSIPCGVTGIGDASAAFS
jgi:hypothetical protein